MKNIALHWQILIAMIAAAVVGIVLNVNVGCYETPGFVDVCGGAVQLYGMDQPVAVPGCKVWIHDSTSQTLIQIDPRDVDAVVGVEPTSRRIVVAADIESADRDFNKLGWPDLPNHNGRPIAVARTIAVTVKQLQKKDAAAYALFRRHGRSTARTVGDLSETIGNLFLRMLMMVSVPLIITSLITGITGLGKAERLGKMFGRTILYYIATSLLAICTGLIVFNMIDPGGDTPPTMLANVAVEENVAAARDAVGGKPTAREGKELTTVLFEQIENMIPPNPFAAIASANFLSVIAFSLAFGICTILVGGRTAEVIGGFFESAFNVMMTMTMLIIRLAPYGVFFLMLSATATQGLVVFGTLGWYMLTVSCALFFHAVIVLPLILRFVAKRDPWEFAKAMSPALFTAFSSASSNGTLPLTLTCVEERAKISNRVGSFVLPLGATINMDGTALYEVVAVMFIANLTPGVDLSLGEQIIIAYTALLASIGAAGIPHAGLVMMLIILQAVGLPVEKQGLIIAVDRVLDMSRTVVNVWSDSCGCAVISRFEAETGPAAKIELPVEASVDV